MKKTQFKMSQRCTYYQKFILLNLVTFEYVTWHSMLKLKLKGVVKALDRLGKVVPGKVWEEIVVLVR